MAQQQSHLHHSLHSSYHHQQPQQRLQQQQQNNNNSMNMLPPAPQRSSKRQAAIATSYQPRQSPDSSTNVATGGMQQGGDGVDACGSMRLPMIGGQDPLMSLSKRAKIESAMGSESPGGMGEFMDSKSKFYKMEQHTQVINCLIYSPPPPTNPHSQRVNTSHAPLPILIPHQAKILLQRVVLHSNRHSPVSSAEVGGRLRRLFLDISWHGLLFRGLLLDVYLLGLLLQMLLGLLLDHPCLTLLPPQDVRGRRESQVGGLASGEHHLCVWAWLALLCRSVAEESLRIG